MQSQPLFQKPVCSRYTVFKSPRCSQNISLARLSSEGHKGKQLLLQRWKMEVTVQSDHHPTVEKATALLTTEEVFSAQAQGKYFLITQQQLGRMCPKPARSCSMRKTRAAWNCHQQQESKSLDSALVTVLKQMTGHITRLQRFKFNRPVCRTSGWSLHLTL